MATKTKTTKKRGPGRPSIAAADRADVNLNFRIRASDRERYKEAAAKKGQTLTAWILALCERGAAK